MASGKESVMPAAKPPEFRRRALDLVGQGEPVGRVARDLGMEIEILKRASAYFARENVLPK